MPVYIDTHEGTTELPSALRHDVTERVRSGEKDAHGVIDRGIIIDRQGNKMHCVLEAPDIEAVKQHHAALNVPVEHATIHEADVILKE